MAAAAGARTVQHQHRSRRLSAGQSDRPSERTARRRDSRLGVVDPRRSLRGLRLPCHVLANFPRGLPGPRRRGHRSARHTGRSVLRRQLLRPHGQGRDSLLGFLHGLQHVPHCSHYPGHRETRAGRQCGQCGRREDRRSRTPHCRPRRGNWRAMSADKKDHRRLEWSERSGLA